jgi:general secretion pathway protein G
LVRRRSEPRVFFPWEKRRGVLSVVGRTRIRLVLCGALGLGFLWILHRREEDAAAVRATRATLTTAWSAIEAYRADHSDGCPRSMREIVLGGYARDELVDAWGHPLRLICPGRKDPAGFDLSSDGPDGLPGGLDRVQ